MSDRLVWIDCEMTGLDLGADALIEVDYRLIRELDPQYGGVIWAMEVEDYQRYGVIVTDDAGNMARLAKHETNLSRIMAGGFEAGLPGRDMVIMRGQYVCWHGDLAEIDRHAAQFDAAGPCQGVILIHLA